MMNQKPSPFSPVCMYLGEWVTKISRKPNTNSRGAAPTGALRQGDSLNHAMWKKTAKTPIVDMGFLPLTVSYDSGCVFIYFFSLWNISSWYHLIYWRISYMRADQNKLSTTIKRFWSPLFVWRQELKLGPPSCTSHCCCVFSCSFGGNKLFELNWIELSVGRLAPLNFILRF